MPDTISRLRELLGDKAVRDDSSSLQAYGVDRTTQWTANPLCVVFPESVEQVQAIVRLANDQAFALVPSGGRTGLSGGAVAQHGEVVLSLDRMNRILDFNAVDQCVTVQAGLITQRLQEYAAEQDLFYPVDFASAGSSQIGGNIATNAGGIKVIRYGMTRDWVLGLKVVTGRGDVLELNHGLIKNNTGYDFRHLMIGSEGTLGIIVEATMALANKPADPCVMVVGMQDFDAVLRYLQSFKEKLSLSAFECFSDIGLKKVTREHELQAPFEQSCPYYALLEFDDSEANLALAAELFETGLNEGWLSDGVVSQSLQQAENLWKLREYLSETLSRWKPYKNDISVKVSQLSAFLQDANTLVQEQYPDFEVVWYGHIGDGNLHLNILKPDDWSVADFSARCANTTTQISALVHRYKGSISAEHGVGLLKQDYLSYSRSEAEIKLMQGIKTILDPNKRLNPGKLLN